MIHLNYLSNLNKYNNYNKMKSHGLKSIHETIKLICEKHKREKNEPKINWDFLKNEKYIISLNNKNQIVSLNSKKLILNCICFLSLSLLYYLKFSF